MAKFGWKIRSSWKLWDGLLKKLDFVLMSKRAQIFENVFLEKGFSDRIVIFGLVVSYDLYQEKNWFI